MLPFIACPTCGKPIGDVAPIFNIVAKKIMLKMYADQNYQYMPNHQSSVSLDTDNRMAPIINALKIDKCCKVHLISSVRFMDHY